MNKAAKDSFIGAFILMIEDDIALAKKNGVFAPLFVEMTDKEIMLAIADEIKAQYQQNSTGRV